jgi:hypothetical protein
LLAVISESTSFEAYAPARATATSLPRLCVPLAFEIDPPTERHVNGRGGFCRERYAVQGGYVGIADVGPDRTTDRVEHCRGTDRHRLRALVDLGIVIVIIVVIIIVIARVGTRLLAPGDRDGTGLGKDACVIGRGERDRAPVDATLLPSIYAQTCSVSVFVEPAPASAMLFSVLDA